MKLDDKGRCCGKKPLVYKRRRQLFCTRCNRSYDLNTREQVENLAWVRNKNSGEWIEKECVLPEPAEPLRIRTTTL